MMITQWYLLNLVKMIKNNFGQLIFSENDVVDLVMQGKDISSMSNMIVDQSVDTSQLVQLLENHEFLNTWQTNSDKSITVQQFDAENQSNWFMPDKYKQFDVAEYVLGLCKTQEELQRVGHELLLFQERDLFNVLRYMKYLVDVMRENNLVWGVGRGSSVASYVLYLLGVHRVNSMFYDLDVNEFLR